MKGALVLLGLCALAGIVTTHVDARRSLSQSESLGALCVYVFVLLCCWYVKVCVYMCICVCVCVCVCVYVYELSLSLSLFLSRCAHVRLFHSHTHTHTPHLSVCLITICSVYHTVSLGGSACNSGNATDNLVECCTHVRTLYI
jgi:hypothetical protein